MNRDRGGPPGEGKKLWVAEELITFKAADENTGGAYALTDSVVLPRGGPPPHVHHREDEAFWVLEAGTGGYRERGQVRGWCRAFRSPPRGRSPLLPERRHRARQVPDVDGPGRLGGVFEEVGEPGTDLSSPPPFEEEDLDRLLAVAPKYGAEIPSPPEP